MTRTNIRRGAATGAAALVLWAGAGLAETYVLPPSEDVVGEEQWVFAGEEDTLADIAVRHGIGYDELVLANPKVDRWLPGDGTPVLLPTRYVLPQASRAGIVINIAEMRLYYFPPPGPNGRRTVTTFPVGIGRDDWETPVGVTHVTDRVRDPAWYPPESIKREHAAEGEILPDVVPPGPDNPLGALALRLALPNRLIHGTNKPFSVGMRVTHGCIRLYPQDIQALFNLVAVGTPVQIVDQPYKIGVAGEAVYVEVHPARGPDAGADQFVKRLTSLTLPGSARAVAKLDWRVLENMVLNPNGVPAAVTRAAGTLASLESAGGSR